MKENLKKWFDEDWVRIDTQGNITGPCGTMKNKKNPSRCLPRAKANSLTKAERAATARKKKAAGKKGKTVVPNTKKAKVTRESVIKLVLEGIGKDYLDKTAIAFYGAKDSDSAEVKPNANDVAMYISDTETDEIHEQALMDFIENGNYKIEEVAEYQFLPDKYDFLTGGGAGDFDSSIIILRIVDETGNHIPIPGSKGKKSYPFFASSDRGPLSNHYPLLEKKHIKILKSISDIFDPQQVYEKYINYKAKVTTEMNTNKISKKLVVQLIKEIITEKKDDRCTRIAKQKYDTWPSAYASAAVTRCRQGKIWKKKVNEDLKKPQRVNIPIKPIDRLSDIYKEGTWPAGIEDYTVTFDSDATARGIRDPGILNLLDEILRNGGWRKKDSETGEEVVDKSHRKILDMFTKGRQKEIIDELKKILYTITVKGGTYKDKIYYKKTITKKQYDFLNKFLAKPYGLEIKLVKPKEQIDAEAITPKDGNWPRKIDKPGFLNAMALRLDNFNFRQEVHNMLAMILKKIQKNKYLIDRDDLVYLQDRFNLEIKTSEVKNNDETN